jgi:hypothetical protein
MTQDDYKLWTGETVSYSDTDWQRIVNVAKTRLASFLCLESWPEQVADDLEMLLANFICAVLRWQGTPEASVSSKSVRNFTISFSSDSAINAFAQVAKNYSDIIEKYSLCDSGLEVEKSKVYNCSRKAAGECCGDRI